LMSSTKSKVGPGPGDACRIEVMTPGWVKMSKSTLVASCPQMAGWNDLNVTRRGNAVARKWTGEDLEFKASVASSRYEVGEVYLLLPDKGADFVAEDGAPLSSGEEVSQILQTKRVEEQKRYAIGSPQEDHFYWEVFGTGMPATVNVEVTGVLKTIRINVTGLGDGAHRVEAWSGGAQLGASDFEGKTAHSFEFAAEGLKQPGETLSLQLKATGAVPFDGQYLDWVELDQEVELVTGTDYVLDRRFSGDLLFNVGLAAAEAYDVTDPDNAIPLQGTERITGGPNDILKVGVKSTKKARTIRVVSASDAQPTKELSPAEQISWPTAMNYLVITDPSYTNAIAPLLTHRQGQGLSTAVVEMNAIRDSVGHGFKEPAAIRAFMEELVKRNGQAPKYVLLVGSATVDPRDYLAQGDRNQVPTEFIIRAYSEYEAPADDGLLPDSLRETVAIGRLPARDVGRVSQWVTKLIANEGVAHGKALVMVDTSEIQIFKDMSKHMIEYDFPPTWMAGERQFLRDNNTVSDILSAGPNRYDLVAYLGHAQPQGWGNHLQLGQAASLPEVIWTLGMSMDCYDGHFADPKNEALAWDLASVAGRGALGYYTPASVAAPPEHRKVFGKITEQLGGSDPIRFGDAMLAAEKIIRAAGEAYAHVASLYNLIGDPAMAWHGMPPGAPSTQSDAGPGPSADDEPGTGCSCRVGAQSGGGALLAFALVLVVLGFRRRRR
ncbi:MAG: C25 family cysteine peptidase, partial [Pseudomonadota bacterium]